MPTPITPYLVYGTVKDENSAIVTSVAVTAHDTTTGERTTSVTNSEGKYIIDLANLESGWTSGDSITVSVRTKGYIGETTFTQSGEGGRETNFSVETITFATIRNKSWMILYNTLQAGTYAISEDSIFSAMNDKIVQDEGYPIVIIEPPQVTNSKLTLDRSGIRKRDVSFNIQVYHKTSENAKILADEVENKIDSAWNVFHHAGLTNLEFP